jgi:hypothetical protein
MNIELLYTSAPQGLKQGSRGFCTVLSTVGLPINLAQKLESLSAYRHLYQPGDPRADSNPICHSHLRFQVGGRTVSVLSRVAAYGVDYSQRTNKIAHHIALAAPLPRCGPAAVLSQPGFMRTEWDNQCRTLSAGPEVPSITLVPSVCQEWEKRTGDAGWAGVVANAWLQTSGKPVWIIFSEWQSSGLLAMMNEATAILPENRRWQATFSTYCTNLPPDIDCRVRCVIQGSDEARMAIARGLVIDLTKPMPNAVGSPAAQAARMGQTIGSVTAISASGSLDPVETFGTEPSASGEAEISDSAQEYQLEGLSSTPPAFLPPKWPEKNRSKSSQPSRTMQRRWKSAAIIGTAAVLLLGLTAGGLYLVWKSSRISAVIATLPIEAEPLQQPPVVDERSIAKDAEEPKAAPHVEPKNVDLSNADQAKEEVKATNEINIQFKQQESWPENKPVPKDKVIAVVSIEGKSDAIVTMKDGHNWFDFKNETKQIFLKESKSFDYEAQKTIQATFECEGIEKTLAIDITNVNEPTLKLLILDENDNNKPLDFVFAGQTVHVTRTGYINDLSTMTLPSLQWEGKTAIDGRWERITDATSESFVVSGDRGYRKIRCCASDDAVSNTAETNEVTICPDGEVTVDIADLIQASRESATLPWMKIQIAFPSLEAIKPKEVYRFDFADIFQGSIVQGRSPVLSRNFDSSSNSVGQYVFPEKLFRRASDSHASDYSEIVISRLIYASKVSQAALNIFKDYIRSIESSGELISELKAFFRSLELPNNINELKEIAAFMDDIESLRQLQEFFRNVPVGSQREIAADIKKLQESINDLPGEDGGKRANELMMLKNELSLVILSTRFSNFETAFPNFLKARLKNRSNLNPNPFQEIRLLSKGLHDSQRRNSEIKDSWNALISTTRDLINAIDSTTDLELTLVGNSNVKVWAAEKSTDESSFQKKATDNEKKVAVPVRFKLRVIPLAETIVAKSRKNSLRNNDSAVPKGSKPLSTVEVEKVKP